MSLKEFSDELMKVHGGNVSVDRIVIGGHARDASPNEIMNNCSSGDESSSEKPRKTKRKTKFQELKDSAPESTKFY